MEIYVLVFDTFATIFVNLFVRPRCETKAVLTCDFITLTFDLSTSESGHGLPFMSFLPANVQLATLFCSRFSDRQTDRQTDSRKRASLHYALAVGPGHNKPACLLQLGNRVTRIDFACHFCPTVVVLVLRVCVKTMLSFSAELQSCSAAIATVQRTTAHQRPTPLTVD